VPLAPASRRDEIGIAGQPDFWEGLDALGERRYYAPVDMKGMP